MPLGIELGLSPGDFVLDGDIVLDGTQLCRERGTAPTSFRPMSIVATVASLSYG